MRPKTSTKAYLHAQRLLNDIGFDEITELSMDMLVAGLGSVLIEQPLKNADGRIVRGKRKSLIKINSDIPYPTRKRFAIAHEIGHLLMHKDLGIHNENSNTLSWFKNTENQLKKGRQELEANEFAVELLMPSELFYKEAYGKPFGPELLNYLSNRFCTSISSTIFRYLQFPLHPICVIFSSGKNVQYWKKSDDLKVWVKNITKLPPPSDSVASEYIDSDYAFIYQGAEKKQEIGKSTWFELKEEEEDRKFYEYCVSMKTYDTVLSVIWED